MAERVVKYEIIRYEVYKDGKSDHISYPKIVTDLEGVKAELEKKHACFARTFTGTKRIGEIFLTYKTLKE